MKRWLSVNVNMLTTLALAWWGSFLALLALKFDVFIGFIIMGGITITFAVLYLIDDYSKRKHVKQLPFFPFFTLKRYRVFYSLVTGVEVFEGILAIYVGLAYFQLVSIFQLPVNLTYINVFFVCLMVVGSLFLVNVVHRFIKWKKPSEIT